MNLPSQLTCQSLISFCLQAILGVFKSGARFSVMIFARRGQKQSWEIDAADALLYSHGMPLSWNEIRHNAIKFAGEWKGATSESAEKQTFWNEFFQVFGIKRRVVASFEEPAKRISGTYGFIDLLWRGVLLVEHKSFGEDLGKAKAQAFNYIQDLVNQGRHAEIPRYIIVSDFARVALHDLEPEEQRDLPLFDKRRGTTIEFPLADFHRYIHAFPIPCGRLCLLPNLVALQHRGRK
jgi:hypothetical protein